METVYAAADLVLLTSDNEGMPVSLIEAALAGLPAVATEVGSVAEVVQREVTGILTDTSHEALARAVTRLLTNEKLRCDMGARARVWATAQFGPERLTSDIEQLYESVALARGLRQSPTCQSAPEEIM